VAYPARFCGGQRFSRRVLRDGHIPVRAVAATCAPGLIMLGGAGLQGRPAACPLISLDFLGSFCAPVGSRRRNSFQIEKSNYRDLEKCLT
jgi:hypothetical protein